MVLSTARRGVFYFTVPLLLHSLSVPRQPSHRQALGAREVIRIVVITQDCFKAEVCPDDGVPQSENDAFNRRRRYSDDFEGGSAFLEVYACLLRVTHIPNKGGLCTGCQ